MHPWLLYFCSAVRPGRGTSAPHIVANLLPGHALHPKSKLNTNVSSKTVGLHNQVRAPCCTGVVTEARAAWNSFDGDARCSHHDQPLTGGYG
jgi:hypothetical protein